MAEIYNEKEEIEKGFLTLKKRDGDVELVIVDSTGKDYNDSSVVLFIDENGEVFTNRVVSQMAANAAGLNLTSLGEIKIR